MKKHFVILALLLCLVGCKSDAPDYTFQNQGEAIVSIELIHNHNEYGFGIDETNFHSIEFLDKEELVSFMNQIYDLEITCVDFMGPLFGYGEYFARVTYLNGDIEIYGSGNIEYVEADDTPSGFGIFYFQNPDEFLNVLLTYIDIPVEEPSE